MPFVACPLCSKRYPDTLIARHAAYCSPSASSTIKKKRSKAHERRTVSLKGLRPRFALKPPSSGDPSETGAPGFHVFPEAFTDIQSSLLDAVHETAPGWTDHRFRQSKNYGPPYNLRERQFQFGPNAPPENKMPTYATNVVIPRLVQAHPLLLQFSPNQMTAGLYPMPSDTHILPHNDCENGHIGTAVVGVCLGAACTMTLILRKKDSGVGRDVKQDVYLPAGSVYVMSGDALRVWHHAIFSGRTTGTRVSLTFRDVSPHKGPGQVREALSK